MGENLKTKDSLMKRLLSSGTLSHGDYSSSIPSPSSDTGEDSSTKFANFLRHLACQSGLELNVVTVDHAYSKPSTWRSQNSNAQPTKTLFFSHVPSQRETRINGDAEVDIDNVADTPAPPYNIPAVKASMGECEAYISSMKPGDDEEDWEERVNRTGWTALQYKVFGKMVGILNVDRLARLTCEGAPNEPIQRRNIVDKSTRRMRQLLSCYSWETRIIQWLHITLLENLSASYLAIYLDILQCMRAKIPVLVDRMIATSSAVSRPGLNGLESLNVILKPPWDPVASCLNEFKPRRLPGNPVLLMVPSAPVCTSALSPRQKMWENYFSSLGIVSSVTVKSDAETSKMTLSNCLDQMMCATRVKVAHLRAEYPGKHIILVGWNAGATAACHIALVEPVTAVICLGFAISTVEGKRGEPNDTLLDLPTPVLFVIGENAATTQRPDLEDMRQSMRVETGLVVVGGADDQLRVSSSRKFAKGVTQNMVDRCILDEVGNFLGGILMYPRPISVRSNTNMSGHMSSDPGNGILKVEKRKISSSEPNLKRSRPGTPLHAAVHPMTTSASASPATSKSTLTTLPTLVSVSGNKGPRQKPRITAAQKLQSNPGSPEVKWAGQQQVGSNPDQASQGITVNIGSLGSLTPIGPIRLSQSNSTSLQTNSQPLSDGTSLTIQGNLVSSAMEKTPTSQSMNKPSETATLTSLSSLLQGNPAARIMVSSASSTGQHLKDKLSEASTSNTSTRMRTTSGRVLDLSKLTVLTPTSSGNVVMLAESPRAPLLVPVSSVSSPFTLVPLANKAGRPSADRGTAQRSYTVIPKITVPSLKLNNPVSQASEAEIKDEEDVLSAAKILELPIIFAKDGEDPILSEDKLGPESLESPTVVPISSCGSGESSSTVTLGDTISFPLESEPESEKAKTVPNVFIIRSKNARDKPPVKPASRIKYTKIILTNRNASGKVEGSISVRQDQPGPSESADDVSIP